MNSKLVSTIFFIIILISPLVFFTDLTRNPYYFQIVFAQAGMVLLWIIILLKQNAIKHKISPVDFPMLCFYSFAIFSWIISLLFLSHNYHIPQLITDSLNVYHKNFLKYSIFNEGFKKFLFTITNVLLVYFFATNFVNKENFGWIYHTLFFVGLLASIYGVLQYFGIELIWPKTLNPFGGRCVSTFGNPNFLSSYLILLFPVSLAYYLYNKNTVFMFLCMISYFCALMATLTRSSWAGLGISLIFFILLTYFTQKELIKKKSLVFLIVSLVLIFLFWPQSPIGGNPPPVGRIFETTQTLTKPQSVYGPFHQRLMIWLCGFEMIKEKFITGKGWGLYELFYPFYQGYYLFLEKFKGLRTHANNAHNEIIEVWAQTGIIGLGLYILFYVVLFIYSYKLIKFTQEKFDKLLIIGLLSSVVGMLVDNLLNVTIHFCIPAFLYFFNIGAIPSFDPTRKEKIIKFNTISKIALVLVGSMIILRLIFNFIGEINYFKGFKYSKRNEIELAIKYLSNANKAQKYEVNNNYELANNYARAKRLKEAIYYYYEALASNCGYDEIHFNLATVYSQIGNFDMAKLHYSQALFINPLSKEAYMALGSILLTNIEQNLTPAIKLFEQAVEIFPDNKDFFNNLGYLYIKSGEEKKALECYYKALQIDPNYEFAKRNYIALSKKLNLKNTPLDKYESLMSQLNQKISQQNFDDAIKLCNEILQLFPKDTLAKFYLANIYFSKNDYDTAIKLYNEIISDNPENLTARYNLALAYIQQKKFSLAKEQLNFIISHNPPNVEQIKKQLEAISNFQ